MANKSKIFQIERNKHENRHAFNSESKKKAATISAAANETLGQEDRRKAKAREGIPPKAKRSKILQIERNNHENRHTFCGESKKKAATISAATNETLAQEDRRKAKARGGSPPRRKDQRFFKSSGTTTKTDTRSAAKAKRRLPL